MAKDYSIVDKVLEIKEGRTEIASHEFFQKPIVKAVIPEGVKKIGYWGFGGCKKLESVVLPASLESIAPEAFALCPLKEIVFTDGCPNLKEVNINAFGPTAPWTKQQLEEHEYVSMGTVLLLHRSGSQNVVIPNGIEIIGENSLCEDAMEQLLVPEGVKIIGRGAFSGCKKLKSVQLPNSLETIEDSAFSGCKELKEIILPERLKVLGASVFNMCTSLETVVFPEKLKSIGENLFTGVFALSSQNSSVKNVNSLIPAMLNGCKLNTKTSMWLLENLWKDEQSLKEIAVIYLTQSGTKVLAQAGLILWRNKEQAVSIMKELKDSNKLKPATIKKIDAFLEK